MDGRADGRADGRTDGRAGGWTGGRIDGQAGGGPAADGQHMTAYRGHFVKEMLLFQGMALISYEIVSGPSILGPDPSQTLNCRLQFRSVLFLSSGVRQVSRSSLLHDERRK